MENLLGVLKQRSTVARALPATPASLALGSPPPYKRPPGLSGPWGWRKGQLWACSSHTTGSPRNSPVRHQYGYQCAELECGGVRGPGQGPESGTPAAGMPHPFPLSLLPPSSPWTPAQFTSSYLLRSSAPRLNVAAPDCALEPPLEQSKNTPTAPHPRKLGRAWGFLNMLPWWL